jgi:AcrR family transcriptional regulator
MAAGGLRERKKAQTRERIAQVALELFDAQGFHATTIRQVADAAGVSPRTVSGYFPSKEELAFPDQDAFFTALERRVTEREPGETAAQALRGWVVWMLGEVEHADRDELRRRRRVVDAEPALRTHERGLQERAERVIAAAAAVDLGLPADALTPHMVGAATIAAFDRLGEVLKTVPDKGFHERALALADEALAFVGGGIAALAARR